MCHVFLIWGTISILFFLDCFVILLCMVFILATHLEQRTFHKCYISNSFRKYFHLPYFIFSAKQLYH